MTETTRMTGPVLIVEDDPDIAEVMRYVLENENLKLALHTVAKKDYPPASINKIPLP